ncbi:MAG: hypothetical protein KXJ53_03065 [Phenylobacterium sp.]|jgi:hypothetical protein|nr:hypothetical protein [Phenylobacterium sp.]
MLYDDGSEVMLGHLVAVPVPSGAETGRVVMLGDTYAHLDIDPEFIAWVVRDRVLEPSSIVIEWVKENPFAHDDPRYASAGRYMFTAVDEFVTRVG